MGQAALRREPVEAARPATTSAALDEACRALRAAFDMPDGELERREPSPAIAAFEAEFTDHAARWAQARRDALAGTGCPDAPIRDRAPGLRDPEPITRRFLHV